MLAALHLGEHNPKAYGRQFGLCGCTYTVTRLHRHVGSGRVRRSVPQAPGQLSSAQEAPPGPAPLALPASLPSPSTPHPIFACISFHFRRDDKHL